MKILIAGLGSIGRRHLRNLVALGERDLILYRTERGTLPANDLAGLPTVTTLEAGLDQKPDAVLVCNPTALHLEVAVPAAEAGCHLFLEKPISHSVEGLDHLRGAVERGRGRVLVGFQFRFHPTLRRVKVIVEDGALGRIASARAHWGEYLPGWHPWEDFSRSYAARKDLGGGALLTLCHPLDYLAWILGEAQSVQGMLAGGLGLNVDAVMEASLRYASGALAHVHLDYVQRPPQHTLEIVGESGFVRWNGFTGDLDICAAADGAWTHETPPAGFERNDMFLDEMRNFLRVARGESSPMCSLEEGLCVQWIIERIRASAEGGMPDDGSAPDGSVMPHPGPTKRTGRSGGATG